MWISIKKVGMAGWSRAPRAPRHRGEHRVGYVVPDPAAPLSTAYVFVRMEQADVLSSVQ